MLGETSFLNQAVQFLEKNPSLFDKDVRSHVFELTIRAIGGLLSAHVLVQRDPSLVMIPAYNGTFLRSAVALADRLMPAFDTPTGLPTSWINLRAKHMRGDTRVTCTACAGTLLLEMGLLSRLTGHRIYEEKAKHAVKFLWSKRSTRNLLGNTINVDTGSWVRRDSGIGAGIDSFYEYLLKSYLAFGDEEYLHMFAESYASAQAFMALPVSYTGVNWLVDVHMTSGRLLHAYVSSLSAFWPGLQVLAGQIADAKALHVSWTSVWETFGWIPEMFQLNLVHQHPSMVGYPLRPEMIESAFMLYSATNDHKYLKIAASMQEKIASNTRGACGHASIAEVATGRMEDTMESFFLSETAKYLYLIFANATGVVDNFVLSTEGHFFPIFPDTPPGDTPRGSGGGNGGKKIADGRQHTVYNHKKFTSHATSAEEHAAATCSLLCSPAASTAATARTTLLRKVLPRLPLDPGAPSLLVHRRCTACKAVTLATTRAKHRADLIWRTAGDNPKKVNRVTSAPPQWTMARMKIAPYLRQFLCHLVPLEVAKLHCALVKEIEKSELNSQGLQALPQNAVFVGAVNMTTIESTLSEAQLAESLVEAIVVYQEDEEGETNVNGSGDGDNNTSHTENTTAVSRKSRGRSSMVKLPAVIAAFGPSFLPNCNSTHQQSIDTATLTWADVMKERLLYDIEDDEEVEVEKDETEEEVKERIALFAQQDKESSSPSGSGGGGGRGGDGVHAPPGGDTAASQKMIDKVDHEDEYLDPDDDDDESMHDSNASKTIAIQDAYGHTHTVLAPVCDIQARPVFAEPFDGCNTLLNIEALRGNMAVMLRGNCSFQFKVAAAEAAGAIAALIINTSDEDDQQGTMIPMGGDPLVKEASIPAVMVRKRDKYPVGLAVQKGGMVHIWSPSKRRKLQLARRVLKHVALRGQDEENNVCRVESVHSVMVWPTCSKDISDKMNYSIELIIPPNSQAWVMHHMYQQPMDFYPAFHQVADILVPGYDM